LLSLHILLSGGDYLKYSLYKSWDRFGLVFKLGKALDDRFFFLFCRFDGTPAIMKSGQIVQSVGMALQSQKLMQ